MLAKGFLRSSKDPLRSAKSASRPIKGPTRLCKAFSVLRRGKSPLGSDQTRVLPGQIKNLANLTKTLSK